MKTYDLYLSLATATGPVAQRIRYVTTNQGIAGTYPARVKYFVLEETQ